MSQISTYYLMKHEKELAEMQEEQSRYCPDFNSWVKELENDPEYLEKVEAKLDAELGVNRLF